MATYLLDNNKYAEDIGLYSEVVVTGKFDDDSLLVKTPSGLEIPVDKSELELKDVERTRIKVMIPMSMAYKYRIIGRLNEEQSTNRVSNVQRKGFFTATARQNESNLMVAEAAAVNADRTRNVWKLGELYTKAVQFPETRKGKTVTQYAKEVLNTDLHTVKRYALIFSRFSQYGLTLEDFTAIGSITKAHIIAEYITDETKDTLLRLSREYDSKKAFAVEVRSRFASVKTKVDTPDLNIYNYRVQLTANQKEDIDAAIAIAAKLKGTHNTSAFDKGQLLTYIVCEWVKELARQRDLQTKDVINDLYVERVVGG